MKKQPKRTQNGRKRTQNAPEITSSAFYRPFFEYQQRPHAGTLEAIDKPELMVNAARGYYQTREMVVHLQAESDTSYGKGNPSPFLQLIATYQGRTYWVYFLEYPDPATVRRRAQRFARQVLAMAQAQAIRATFGADVKPATQTPATWPAKQPELFDGGTITRAYHLDDLEAVLSMLQNLADIGTVQQTLRHALKAVAVQRKFYGIPAPETPAGK